MENEILQQILETQKQILSKVGTLEHDVSGIKQDVTELKQGQTRLEVIIETEIKPQIKIVAEQHGTIVEKLDGLPEKIASLQDETQVHGAVIKTLAQRTAKL